MSQIEEKKEEELKIKVEYGIANLTYLPTPVEEKGGKYKVKFVKDVAIFHRSGRRTGFLIPEPFKKLLLPKMKGLIGVKRVEFAMATHRYEEPREVFNVVYAIAIKHKFDTFSRSVAREIVTGRIKRYMKDGYIKEIKQLLPGTLSNGKQEGISWVTGKPDFIHVEQEVVA